MNKIMAKNIQRDLSEAKTVRQSLDAMGRAISVTVGCQLSTGRRQKRQELLSWITLAIVALICFFELSRTIEQNDPGVQVAMGVTCRNSSSCREMVSTIGSKETGASITTEDRTPSPTDLSPTERRFHPSCDRSAAIPTRLPASTPPSSTIGSTGEAEPKTTASSQTESTATCKSGTASPNTKLGSSILRCGCVVARVGTTNER